ncbi:LrgB family protein [Fictibacillus sp. NRS-1165]|uniref:LrgB family protein n=1 Tax=Fictibacillus sp. NRS-1165 TaxID=3144463 RepID=UPI003D20FA23
MHWTSLIFIVITVLLFIAMRKIYERWRSAFLIPVLTTTLFMAVILLLTHIPYEKYMEGGKWIEELLGPGVVALAYPLYLYRESLMRHLLPIIVGVPPKSHQLKFVDLLLKASLTKSILRREWEDSRGLKD